jgi:hypothetical protein
MERKDFQRILSLVDTIHDYKASSRGNLMDAKIFQEALYYEFQNHGINVPKKGTKEKPRISIIIENVLNKGDDFFIDLQKLKDGLDEDIELPYYIDEFIGEFSKCSKNKLVELINLIQSPPKNMPYNPNRLIETLMLIFIHDGFRESLGLSRKQHYIKDKKANCSNIHKINDNLTAKDFCELIYADTYPINNLSRSIAKLEEKILDISTTYATQYIKNSSKKVISYKNINSLKESKYVKVCLGKKNALEGIYKNANTSSNQFLNIVKLFYDVDEVYFAYDSNGIENIWMENNRYKGVFVDFDSLNQDAKIKIKKGGMPLGFIDRNYEEEFQQYKLTKKKHELILFDTISIINKENNYIVKLSFGSQTKEIKTENRSKGLPMFLKFFDEITKRTLGYKNISTSNFIKDQLAKGLKKLCLDEFKIMYKITLQELDDSEKEYLKLKKEDFIKALFDIKRSMDYLYVKACCTANMREKLAANPGFPINAKKAINLPNKQEKKFIFVSLDKSAIAYALMLNTPCILTTTQGGYKYIELFNPDEKFYNYDEILDEYSNNNANANANANTSQRNSARNAKNTLHNTFEYIKQDPHFKELLNYLQNIKFIAPNSIKLGQGATEYKLDECDSWMEQLPSRSKQYAPIMKKICEDYKMQVSKRVGGNNIQKNNNTNTELENAHIDDGVMDQQIPLNDLLSFAEFGSPFYMFLQFYSQLSPSIDFFWFITFKTYFFITYGDMMDKVQEKEFEMEYEQRPKIPRSFSMNQIQQQRPQQQTTRTRNAISNPGTYMSQNSYNTYMSLRK